MPGRLHFATLYIVVKIGFIKKVAFELKFEGGERVNTCVSMGECST